VRITALASALLGGTALVAGLAAAPASAAPAAAPAFAPHHANPHAHPMVGGARHGGFNEDGGNWSGYVATGGSFTSVSADWTEPSVSCDSSSDLYAPWVGIDGYGSSSVEQTGVATDCSSGSPSYQAWYELYPANPVYYNEPVSAGDSFSASVNTDGNGNYTMTIKDNTQGWTESTPGSYQGDNASAEAILESPTAAYPSFGEVDFTNFQINGQDPSAYSPTALDASNSSGFEDHTSALSGGSFSVAYEQE
jgi:Peptidase A4 family